MSKKYKFLYYQLNKRAKVVVIFFTAMIAVNYSSFSQIQFGLESGGGVTTMPIKVKGTIQGIPVDDDEIEQLPRMAFYFGVYGNFQVSNFFSVRPRLYFSNKGAIEKADRYISKEETKNVKTYFNLSYTGIAVMGDFVPVNKVTIGIGPSVEFLLSVKEKNELSTDTSKDNYVIASLGTRLSAKYFLTSKIGCGLEGEFGISKAFKFEVDNNIANYSFARGMRGVYLTVDYRIN